MSVTIYKICPKCSAEHLKPGTFCSRSCANSRGSRTEDFKEKVRKKLKNKPSTKKGVLIVPRVETKCFICDKIIFLTEKAYKKNTRFACDSIDCKREQKSIAGRISASKRVTRSKDEICLYEMCLAKFPSSLPNHIITNNWDADIVIPELNLAILWHGPWHYKEMGMKNHSLKQVKNRDKIKRELFTSLGWKVLEFKDCDYTPQSAFEFILVEGRGYAPLP